MTMRNPHASSRREFLLASGVLFAWTYFPKIARAEGRDPQLLVVVLRGAFDGLAAVAPVGDPDWTALRAATGEGHEHCLSSFRLGADGWRIAQKIPRAK
jgi:uncharacterized protein (DUF1501 family)